MNHRSSKGFTLIELLVVISIISLLSSVILASITEARDRAKGVGFRRQVEEFKIAVELYKSDNAGNLPPITTGSIYTITSTYFSSGMTSTDLAKFNTYFSNYIKSFPTPPFSNGMFQYYYNPNLLCGDSHYMLLVYPGTETTFFSDWINLNGGTVKCFPL